MRLALPGAGLLLWLAALAPAAPDEKSRRDEKPPGKDDRAEKLVPLGQGQGVVESVAEKAGTLTVKFNFRHVEPNPQAIADYQRELQLVARYQAILSIPNPAQRQQQMQQLEQSAQNLRRSQQNLFRVKEVPTTVELQMTPEVKVRLAQPATLFDEKGNIKRYTLKELKEMKGPENLPGFTGSVADLQAGQTVIVAVARKSTPAGKDAPPSPGEEKDKPPPADDKPRPIATHILIVSDPNK